MAPETGAAGRASDARATRRTGPITAARVASVLALAAGAILVFAALFGGGSTHHYRLLFQTGGQLVKGNQVTVGGHPIGSVDSIDLTDDWQAAIEISTDQPLHEGSTAVIRATGLSGVANHYISIAPGPNNEPQIPNDGTITAERTTSPVDIDQLFDEFTPRTRRALRDVIQGQATIYDGNAAGARSTYKYFGPSLESTRKLLAELTSDQTVFSQFLVEGSDALGAIADRRNDLSALTSNANQGLGAIAQENQALDRSLVALPPTLRQANTTFVNLRAALDDLDPLVNEAKPATKNLAPFLKKLRPVSEESIPVFGHLSDAINRKGKANDLTDSLRELPAAEKKASKATPDTIKGLNASQPSVEFARPYMPDLLAFLAKFGEVTAFYDADGHYARVQTAEANFFHYCKTSADPKCTPSYSQGELAPIPPSQQFDDLDFGLFTRCPGGATQPIPGSNPFTDGGNLLAGGQSPNPKCDVSDVPPGP